MESTVTETQHRVDVDGDSLAVVVATPHGGVTDRMSVLLHGGPGGQKNGPEGLYIDLAAHLGATGIASVRFDFRGCGESTGRYRDMTIDRQVQDLLAVRAFVERAYHPTSWGLVGESFGATIALRGLDRSYQALVLLWPAIWLLDGAFESYVTADHIAAAKRDGYVELDGEQIGLDFLQELQTIRDVSAPLQDLAVPLLLIHGEADGEVPFSQSERAAQLAAASRLVPVPDGDHCLERPHEREVVYRESVSWLREHL